MAWEVGAATSQGNWSSRFHELERSEKRFNLEFLQSPKAWILLMVLITHQSLLTEQGFWLK